MIKKILILSISVFILLQGTKYAHSQGKYNKRSLPEAQTSKPQTSEATDPLKAEKIRILFKKGLEALDNMKFPLAASIFESILEEDPSNFMAMRYLGDSLLQLSKTKEAERWILKALKTKKWDVPNDDSFHTKHKLLLAALNNLLKEYRYSIQYANQAIYRKPDSSEGYYWLAKGSSAIRKYEDAISYYEKAIEIDPDYFAAYYGLSETYLHTDQY